MSYVPPAMPSSFYRAPPPPNDKRRREDDGDRGHRHRRDRHWHPESEKGKGGWGDPPDLPLPPPPPLPLPPTLACDERLMRIALENGLDIAYIHPIWQVPRVDVRAHLFDPATGAPRFLLTTDIWKPLVRAYFAWCNIPREMCTRVWGDIVDMLLRMPQLKMVDAEFRAWAFGCLSMFHLEDRERAAREDARRSASVAAATAVGGDRYDPEMNWKTPH